MPLRKEDTLGEGDAGGIAAQKIVRRLSGTDLTARLYARPKAVERPTFRLTKPPKINKPSPSKVRLQPIKSFVPLPRGTNLRFGGGESADVPPPEPSAGDDQVKPLERAKAPILPDISPTRTANSFDDVAHAKGLDMLQLADYIRGFPPGAFFYMMPVHDKMSTEHHAYNLHVVHHDEIDSSDFYTISKDGIEHVIGNTSEYTSLGRWVHEIHKFAQIRQLKTFAKFRLWKQYSVWRNSVVQTNRAKVAAKLEERSFFVDTCLQPALLKVRQLCIDVVELQLLQVDPEKTYPLEEFLAAQNAQIDLVKGSLGGFRDNVLAIVMQACVKLLNERGFPVDENGQDVIQEVNVDDDSQDVNMTYTQQAIKRRVCDRLRNFIRLVDLLVAGAMQALAVESVALLKTHLCAMETESLPSQAQFDRWATPVPVPEEKIDPLNPPPLLTQEEKDKAESKKQLALELKAVETLPHFVELPNGMKIMPRLPEKKKAAKSFARQSKAKEAGGGDAQAKCALLTIDLSMDAEKLMFEPKLDIITEELDNLTELFQSSVIGLQCLLLDDVFLPFTRPVIAGRPADVQLGDGVNLRAVFDDDQNLKVLRTDIKKHLTNSFEGIQSYSKSLERFRLMYKENEAMDEDWVRTTEHLPSFFEESLSKYKRMYSLGASIQPKVVVAIYQLQCDQFKSILLPSPQQCLILIEGVLPKLAAKQNDDLVARVDRVSQGLDVEPETTTEYVANLEFLAGVDEVVKKLELDTKRVTEFYELIDKYELTEKCQPEDIAEHSTLRQAIMRVVDIAKEQVDAMPNKVSKFQDVLDKDISGLGADVLDARTRAQDPIVFDADADVEKALDFTTALFNEMEAYQAKAATFKKYQRQFKIDVTKFNALEETHAEIRGKNALWQGVKKWDELTVQWDNTVFTEIDADTLGGEVQTMFKQVYGLSKSLPPNDVVPALSMKIEQMKAKVPVISDLRNPALKERHWAKINEILESEIDPDKPRDAEGNAVFTLGLLERLNAFEKSEALQEVGGNASSEAALEIMMTKLEENWNGTQNLAPGADGYKEPVYFECLPYRDSKDVYILGGRLDEIQVLLDDSMVAISTISGSRHSLPIKDRVDSMLMSLKLFGDTLEEWLQCQSDWMYLESIFSAPDIQRQLPNEAKMFMEVDKAFKSAMRKTNAFPNALRAGCTPGFLDMFKKNNQLLGTIQKCLEDYLQTKRAAFSRFYFLSNDELLEILSQTRNPLAVQPHMRKCFDAIKTLEFGDGGIDEETGKKKYTTDILAMNAPQGEQVTLGKGLKARGNVEGWLSDVEKAMMKNLKSLAKESIVHYPSVPREEWCQHHCSQVVLMVSQIYWVNECLACLASPDPIKAFQVFEIKAKEELAKLAALARSKVTKLFRKVLGALITIDVHARDIITGLIKNKCDNEKRFDWTKQLRYSWDEEEDTCIVQMSNARCIYSYEYLGADMRLVVTPLTDSCYLCLLGAVQLDLGGAPAGPAGTGKTETTKDLAKAIAIQCVVFNCSDQMDFRMTGRFFAGLAQSGAWCCFDEFNRIDIEVLSVIAQQILTIKNAKTAGQTRFMFDGFDIGLIRTCASFITMNPGYAGRTELPDNLKALFRPMSMMVPDYGLIAEVILYSEGFENPTSLARKMVNMYQLCSEQLSQQDHYDFGMRAVKSVLVMAGSLKRSRIGESEAQVLLTALRDSNLPKFLTDDAILFRAILSDLFPGVELGVHDYGTMQVAIEDCIKEKGLILDPKQVHKIIQFYETMEVRHGVMLVGPTGGGKTTTYEVLKMALEKLGEANDENPECKPVHTYVMNPKSSTMGELYGEVSLATGEWTDGLMATTVRHCVNEANANDVDDHQWIMCDGPVDALWIENMNTVLDDNKMLCLANSERIKLTNWMHMCFEVQDLAVASPATVSRCGMVYVDPKDLEWHPYFGRWLRDLPRLNDELKEFLKTLFDEHMADILYQVRKNYTVTMEQVDLGKVASVLTLLQQLLVDERLNVTVTEDNEGDVKAGIALSFVFAVTWGVGGNLNQQFFEPFDSYIRDKLADVPGMRIPGLGLLYDFYLKLDVSPPALEKWEDIVPTFTYDPAVPYFDMLVPTTTTVKYGYLLKQFTDADHPTLFTGHTGVGKSVVMKNCLDQLETSSSVLPVTINFSAQTDARRTQEIIESKLEKKGKTKLGAPAGKKIVFFVDDLNMPKLDTYGSQPPIELLRTYQDFKGVYDREKLFWKTISNVCLVSACAPPGGGRSPVTPRFIRHFAMFAIPKPDDLALKTIFKQILGGFLSVTEFQKPVQELAGNIVDASVEVYNRISQELLPTPSKSHYLFNLRDLSKVLQGVLQATTETVQQADEIFELYCHETLRVFHDRLTDKHDKEYFCGMLSEMASKHFRKNIEQETFIESPLVFGDFMKVGAQEEDKVYEKCELAKCDKVLDEYLDTYNLESTKEMNLVFFQDAVEHVSRISRVIRQPRGNALLVGVGGTGKQSLTRMACVMAGYQCKQIEITRGYGVQEFHEDLKEMYMATGTKGENMVFLFTDTQIVVESFLEDINNILNSGEVPNLIEPEEMEKFIGPCRRLAKEAGLPETRDAVYGYFINRVREKLHLVLCMSPVGSAFRNRCQMFPSLVNCCTIDWFTAWPREALMSVSKRFFEFVDLGSDEMKEKVSEMCVVIHTSVQTMADRFYDELRRKYYTTPTSYLELINLYTSMLETKRQELMLSRDRYATGMKKIGETDELIGTMQKELTKLTPILAEKSKATGELMVKVKADEAEASKVREVVQREEAIALKDADATEKIKSDAQRDLDSALPALAAAQKALDSLNKNDIGEIKAFATPPELVQTVMEAVCILFERKTDWKTAKNLLGESTFMKGMLEYNKDNVSDKTLKKLKPYIENPKFQPDIVANTSKACRSLCLWVRAIDLYSHVFRTVAPKRAMLKEAETSLAKTMATLKEKQATLKAVEDKIAVLQAQFTESVNAKEELENNMKLTKVRLKRAGQLQASLGDEKVRWAEQVTVFDKQLVDVVGNVFLSSACVAYYGAFTSSYREELVLMWSERCDELRIPRTIGMGISDVLSSPFQIRGWNAASLPNDQLSIENAVLVTQGRRWPLMIDPQDQANTWIRTMERKNGLKIIKLSDGDFLRTLENAIRTGTPVLLEEVEEALDPSLEPILLKQTFKQGGRLLIRLGDSDVDYNKNFRFYMTSKLSNPHYLPEICIKVTIINFTVTIEGLQDQLLGDVVKLERPDLEEQRTKLVMQINEDKEQLKNIEDKILKLLFNSEGNILDDEVLIETLGESKITSTAIGERLIVAEKTEISISEARSKYRPVAIRSAVIYFVIADVGLIDDMYQYSLGYFKNLFTICINDSEKSDDLETRLATIIKFSTANIYTNIARGLFEKHKLVFSFMLCAQIMRQRLDIDMQCWNIFLRGFGAGDKDRPPKPDLGWLTAATWNNVVDLEAQLPFRPKRGLPKVVEEGEEEVEEIKKPLFEGLMADMVARPIYIQLGKMKVCINTPDEWEGCAKETEVDWNERLVPFEKVMLIKITRSELLIDASAEFVSINLGASFVESPPIDLNEVYKDIATTVPLIFVLSSGSDPMSGFQRFAKGMNFDDRYEAISLGQGQGPIAEKLIAEACKTGSWIFLQNCHLAKSWMNGMEVVIKSLALPDAEVHPDFRLYLSSMPCSFFPIGVLQNSVKVTNEPPKGLRANVRGSFAAIDQKEFEENELGKEYRKLIFGLCFFHANILERKKFGPLGWNIRYDFSDTDRATTLTNLTIFLDEQNGSVPWDAMTYLIGEVYYGGRVTDRWDERTLRTVLKRFFVKESLVDGFTYSESGIYYPAGYDTMSEYMKYIETFPFSDDPDIFGLHENANTAFMNAEADRLIQDVLLVQPRLTSSGGEKSPDEIVMEVADMIQEKIRSTLIDIDEHLEGMFALNEHGQVESLATVLKQEIERFNTMLVVLWDVLKNLKKAIKGLVVMNFVLEEVFNCFLNNQVPKVWVNASYPSLAPLGSWVNDLVLRLDFIQQWLLHGPPKSFWLSGFYFPQGFLTGTKQTHARRYNMPIDTLSYQISVVKATVKTTIEITKALAEAELPDTKDGAMVHGLFMEACRWDWDNMKLTDSKPGEMFATLPVLQLTPVCDYVVPLEDYTAPVYKTKVRAGMLSTTGHSTNFVMAVHLPTDKDPDYWVNKGSALMCQDC